MRALRSSTNLRRAAVFPPHARSPQGIPRRARRCCRRLRDVRHPLARRRRRRQRARRAGDESEAHPRPRRHRLPRPRASSRAARAQGHTLTLFNRGKTNPGLLHRRRDHHRRSPHRHRSAARPRVGRGHRHLGDVPKSVHADRRRCSRITSGTTCSSRPSRSTSSARTPIDESSPVLSPKTVNAEKLEGVEDYGGNKALAEREAEEIMPGRATAIRAGVIVGPGDPTDRFIYWPLRMARGGEVLAPGARPTTACSSSTCAISAPSSSAHRRAHRRHLQRGRARRSALLHVLDACRTAAGSTARITFVDTAFLDAEKAGGWTTSRSPSPAATTSPASATSRRKRRSRAA